MGSVPTVSERIRTQAQTAVSASEPSGVMTGRLVLSATMSAVNALFTASSNSEERERRAERRMSKPKIRIVSVLREQT